LYSCQAGSAAVAATQKAFRRAFSKWCCTIATKELSTPPGDIARPHHRTRRFSPDLSGPRGELSCTDLDIAVNGERQVSDAAARAEAKDVIDRWNEQLVSSRDMLWSPAIPAALIAGTLWLDVFCPGCGTSRAICRRELVIGLLRMRRKIV
jgi:hypothetical protein